MNYHDQVTAVLLLEKQGWVDVQAQHVGGGRIHSYDVVATDPQTGYVKRFSRLDQLEGGEGWTVDVRT